MVIAIHTSLTNVTVEHFAPKSSLTLRTEWRLQTSEILRRSSSKLFEEKQVEHNHENLINALEQ